MIPANRLRKSSFLRWQTTQRSYAGDDAGGGFVRRRQSTEIYAASETGNICVEDSASLRYFVNILNSQKYMLPEKTALSERKRVMHFCRAFLVYLLAG